MKIAEQIKKLTQFNGGNTENLTLIGTTIKN